MAPDNKPTKQSGRPLGPTGETVRKNIRTVREGQDIAVTELSARMSDLGRPIPTLGIHRIESGERRVDVDDLAALAVALKVSPVTLLMPDTSTKEAGVEVTGLKRQYTAETVWAWLRGSDHYPVDFESPTAYFGRAWPQWLQDREAEWIAKQDDQQAGMIEKSRQLLAMREGHGND